ncbi:MAG: DNA-3-methyladenine glycosylase I [Hyphomicrobiaceae bacterium]|nr:DNA-3-methyladenine glycosylase I [Hyphomicrobiaceae bacterium]
MTASTPFAKIEARAVKRKGGPKALANLLPAPPTNAALAKLKDDRVLAEMTKRIFSAGFVWSVVEKKWPYFERAFLKFDPKRLVHQPDEFWDALTTNKGIVRHPAKIMSVRTNADFVLRVAKEHGTFGKFLAACPTTDQTGLLDYLAKNGTRLGGMSGQYFLRFVGRDSYVLTHDVVACLRDAGLDIAENPTSKNDLKKIEAQFNAWATETGMPLTTLSRICALSTGENHDAETLISRGMGK